MFSSTVSIVLLHGVAIHILILHHLYTRIDINVELVTLHLEQQEALYNETLYDVTENAT